MRLTNTTFFCAAVLSLATLAGSAQTTFTKVADYGTPIPGGTGNFLSLSSPLFDGTTVVFESIVDPVFSGAAKPGIYRWSGGTLKRVADGTTTVPGSSVLFTNFAYGFASYVGNGIVTFKGESSVGVGYYQHNGTSLSRVFDSSTVSAVPGGTGAFATLYAPVVQGNVVSFIGQDAAGWRGIFQYSNGTLRALVPPGAAYPGGTGKILTSSDLGFADNLVAFWASDSTNFNRNAIFAVTGGSLIKAVEAGITTVPGKSEKFTGLDSPPIVFDGKIIFQGQSSSGAGIFSVNPDGTGLTKLVDSKTAIPGLTGTISYLSLIGYDGTNLVFQVTVQSNNNYYQGFYSLRGGTIKKIVDNKSMVDGKPVSYLSAYGRVYGADQIAFQVAFTNGTTGIYIAKGGTTGGGGGTTDTSRPSISIGTPKATRTILTNGFLLVSGTATDNVGVEQVYCRLNGGPWYSAVSTNNRDWSYGFIATAGSNTVSAYAVDAQGNVSLTNSVTMFDIASGSLTLITNGIGGIVRVGFTGNQLEVGKQYSVTAVPGPGQVFSNWSGGLASTTASLSFLMQSNLSLTANFVPNPFLANIGNYAGIFSPKGAVYATNAGYVSISLTDKGAFTGKLILDGSAIPLSGMFSVSGATMVQARQGTKLLLVSLRLVGSSQMISGQVYGDGWSAYLGAVHLLPAASNTFAGTYTMIVAENSLTKGVGSSSPTAFSPLTLSVTTAGTATLKGFLADGIPVSILSAVTANGSVPYYASLYGNKGILVGWLQLNGPQAGSAYWTKPESLNDKFYPAGFNEIRPVTVAKYLTPTLGHSPVTWTNGVLVVGQGNLAAPLTNTLTVVNNQLRAGNGALSNLVLTVSARDGQVTGNFKLPGAKVVTQFKSVLIQGANTTGAGFFLGTNQSGFVWISQ
ncbi:MAG: Ig-like domain-containing protein [Verrucomicrobiota bacterium]